MLDTKRLSTIGLIVNELITNAMKYAFRSGSGVLEVSVDCTEKLIEISVADNGPGIPSSYDPQTHAGFGLGMVRDLVSQVGGELHVGSNPTADTGTGARITFSFPR